MNESAYLAQLMGIGNALGGAKVNDILVPGPIPKWWDDGSEIADKEQKEEP